MDQANFDNLVSIRLPAIVAVRGRSSPGKSKLARQLADFLKYPLLDEEDILKVSSYSGVVSIPHETCLEIILRMASSQLIRSQTGIVISATAFSYPRVFQRFLDLKNSSGVHLIVILYEPEDHRLDLMDFPAVWINPANSVSMEGRLGRKIRGLFTGEWKTETYNSHFHYLTRGVNQKQRDGKSPSCKRCLKPITDLQIYRCEGCTDCAFHTLCAETPSFYKFAQPYLLDSTERTEIPDCLPCFSGKDLPSSEIKFPTENSCGRCTEKGDFSEECFECLYEAFVRSKSLPAVMNMKWHEHSLRYVIMPRSYGYIYACFICGSTGEMAGYKCTECCLNFHPMCVANSVRDKVKCKLHTKHTLRLHVGGDDKDGYKEASKDGGCDVCDRSIENPLLWKYYCSRCGFRAHTTCVLDNLA